MESVKSPTYSIRGSRKSDNYAIQKSQMPSLEKVIIHRTERSAGKNDMFVRIALGMLLGIVV